MKQFFKFLFASMLGFILGIIVLFFLFIFIVSAAVSSMGTEEVKVSNGSVLQINFSQPIRDRSSNNPFEGLNFSTLKSNKQLGMNDILKSIENASTDDNIKGIFLDFSGLQSGFANIEEIRNKLLEFKKSGKFVYAYSDSYSQGAYYLVSVADKIYLNPQGELTLNGLMTELMFFKGALDKLEIEPEVIRHGKYKSAIEPFILDKMSPENRQQIAGFVDPIWKQMATDIATSRKLNKDEIYKIADSLTIRNAEDALKNGLVDKLAYFDEFLEDVNNKLGQANGEELKLISINKYSKSNPTSKKEFTSDKIAVIYAIGEIEGGKGDDETIGSDKISETIREARLDKNIKAIVLRVNSPGGSALASDVIWREVVLAKRVKPVVVSMGNVAASGGYYISCAANAIVAEPTTITGSIGVFGLMFNAQNMFKNKLGLTFDTYKTSNYTDLGTITRPLTSGEKNILQVQVDEVYNTFTSRVAQGRKMSQADVDSIGQGRVWSGIDAKRIGLVDELGGLDRAIAIAKKMAKLDNYRIKELPVQKEALEELITDLSGEAQAKYLQVKLGPAFSYWEKANELMKIQGIQARSFYQAEFNY
jgi:protease IV